MDDDYQMQKSYAEVIVVCDRDDSGDNPELSKSDMSLRDIAQRQTVLVVRTSTSSEISLNLLLAYALPLDRMDTDGLEVVRVPLAAAVKYMVKLEGTMEESQSIRTRKYDQKLCVYTTPEGFDRIVNTTPETWVAAVIAKAKQDGFDFVEGKYSKRDDNDFFPNEIDRSMMRVRARAEGRLCDYDFELDEWQRRWISGYD